MQEESKMIKLFVFMWVLSIPASVSTGRGKISDLPKSKVDLSSYS